MQCARTFTTLHHASTTANKGPEIKCHHKALLVVSFHIALPSMFVLGVISAFDAAKDCTLFVVSVEM